jgi:FAD synthetase
MNNLSEDPSERARKYIATLEKALQQQTPLKEDRMVEAANIAKVSDAIDRYLQDARFYLDNGKPTTSLASIAYAEGLLDALKFLTLSRTLGSETQ